MPSRQTPSRRMTLGGVVPEHKNRRRSVDPSSVTGSETKTNRRPPRSRKSMIPRVAGRENVVPQSPGVTATTAASRRRSVGGTSDRRKSLLPPPPQPVKADPRPINDKQFQQQCINQLLSFLLESGYDYPISHKSLSRPSAKDFSNICTFMLRRIDPNFQKGTMKFEDEVALNFKCIGYPYTISKTALVAAGSLHTWPALLAALCWLMDHIKSSKEHVPNDSDDAKPFETLQELEVKTDKDFFQYLGQAYMAFMRNDSQMVEQLETGLWERFENDDAFLHQEAERLTDLNAAIAERIDQLQQQSQDLPMYAKKREEYASDVEQFHDLLRQMDDHRKGIEQKVKEKAAQLEKTNEKLAKMNSHIDDLKRMIETQELSVDDIRTMESELKGLGEAMDRAFALRDQRRKTLLASEKELLAVCNHLEAILVDYNTKLSELQLTPRLGSDLKGLKASLQKELLIAEDQSKIFGVSLETTVRPTVETFKSKFIKEVEQTKANYQDCLDKMENSSDACSAAQSKLKIVQDKIAKCEKTLEDEHDAHSAKLAVRQREVEAMENKVAAKRDPVALEEQMAAYERQCAELEALRMEHQEENVARKKAVQDEIEQACDLMVEHDKYFESKVHEVDEYWQKKQTNISTIKAPENIQLDDQ